MYFRSYRIWKAWLDKCLNSPVSWHQGQDVKGSQTLVKSPWDYFYQIVLSLWGKITWKTSLLLIFELLRHFFKTLFPDDKYSLCNIWNLQELYQMQLSKTLKPYFHLSVHFWNLHQILNILKKKMTLLGYLSWKLQTWKAWLDKCLNSPVS